MYGTPPFNSQNKDLLYRKIINCEPEYDEDNNDPEAVDLIKFILIKKQSDRPNIQAIKEHSFFKDLDWDKVKKMQYECPIKDYLENKFNINRIHN